MSILVRPFAGLRPHPEYAADVAAPPYDVLNTEEARAQAEGKLKSFLHISKPEIDLQPGTDPYAPEVYAKGAENLARLVADGVLIRDDLPCYYVYRLRMGDHVQTGVAVGASVAAYDENRIKKHEFTRPQKEDDRVRQITALNAQTGPVLLTFRASEEVRAILAGVTAEPPEYDITAEDGIGHTLWVVRDHTLIERITLAFNALDALYIADGHHRSASASRVAAAARASDPAPSEDKAYASFLAVAFPDDETMILDYNRAVRDLNGLSREDLLAAVGKNFDVTESTGPVRPQGPREFGMYLAGQWYRLRVHDANVPEDDPVARLDVSLLQDNLLHPVLGIGDPRTDNRIDFIGGIRGLAELERRVDSGDMAVSFSLHPTEMSALMAVADAGEVMPPKSTWFEPKLADGLVSHVLD
ncbi:MAG: DUF1015 domain-containing protein [Rhodospirillales bacterium]|nr:DUF1015 domain-containing protein [Rhodospirillales bacterium]